MNNLISRIIEKNITKYLFLGKIIIIYGPRQIGKTTLVNRILKNCQKTKRYFNCDFLSTQQGLSRPEPSDLKSYLGDYDLVVLDEAHKIKNIGLILKILVDTYPKMQIIATGSSSFDLANKISEPLTGRTFRFTLYPLSVQEIAAWSDLFEVSGNLDNLLRFGSYPEVFRAKDNDFAKTRLEDIASNYLYKDILEFDKIKKSSLLTNLLKLLALQIGSEVSCDELARQLGVNRLTVRKYIDLLEQSFVLFSLRSFSRNLCKELSKSEKIYFYDLGIRNCLIQNFNSLDIRNDVGALWENFCVLERVKRNHYQNIFANYYFWRTYDQKEIDFIEERDGKLMAFEFKWGSAKAKNPKEFLKTYKNAEFRVVDKDNFHEFML